MKTRSSALTSSVQSNSKSLGSYLKSFLSGRPVHVVSTVVTPWMVLSLWLPCDKIWPDTWYGRLLFNLTAFLLHLIRNPWILTIYMLTQNKNCLSKAPLQWGVTMWLTSDQYHVPNFPYRKESCPTSFPTSSWLEYEHKGEPACTMWTRTTLLSRAEQENRKAWTQMVSKSGLT